MSGDDSRPSLRAPAQETVFRPFPLASPSGPLYIERMFLLRLCINQSIRYLRLYRSLYSNSSGSQTQTQKLPKTWKPKECRPDFTYSSTVSSPINRVFG